MFKPTLITLGVVDFEKSLKFYEEGLGWKKSSESQETVAFIPFQGIVLSLYPKHLLAEDANVAETGSGFKSFSLAVNTHSEQEVNDFMEKALQAGAKMIKEPQKVFWGGYSGYFADPDGFLWEVAYNPFWKFDQKGNLILPD